MLRERVERGAALLDEHFPGWADEVDLATLDLNNECNCVAAQAVAQEDEFSTPFTRAMAELGLGTVEHEAWGWKHVEIDYAAAAAHGFYIAGGPDSWESLRQEWERYVLERRHALVAS